MQFRAHSKLPIRWREFINTSVLFIGNLVSMPRYLNMAIISEQGVDDDVGRCKRQFTQYCRQTSQFRCRLAKLLAALCEPYRCEYLLLYVACRLYERDSKLWALWELAKDLQGIIRSSAVRLTALSGWLYRILAGEIEPWHFVKGNLEAVLYVSV